MKAKLTRTLGLKDKQSDKGAIEGVPSFLSKTYDLVNVISY